MNQLPNDHAVLKPWAKGIHAITLFEEDLVAARQFYNEVFGWAVLFEDANSCVFKIGTTHINLLKIESVSELISPARMANREAGVRLVFTIQVENVDAVCAELAAQGVKLLNGPMDRPWGIRTASFMDPGGHIWEIAS